MTRKSHALTIIAPLGLEPRLSSSRVQPDKSAERERSFGNGPKPARKSEAHTPFHTPFSPRGVLSFFADFRGRVCRQATTARRIEAVQ